MAVTASSDLDAVLAHRSVFPEFQPIVDLATAAPVAFEALARGPGDSDLRSPDRLFAAARREGRLAELDQLCRTRALEAALEGDLPSRLGLFVNVEPDALDEEFPPELLAALAARDVPVVVEFTERSLLHDPAGLVAYAARLREHGLGVALDDVGAEPASVALMPFLSPDVVKLDMRLVQQQPDSTVAEVMTAVTAYAEQSGAWVLAEGIETEHHELVARSLGARLGQGRRYGWPGALSTAVSPTGTVPVLTHPRAAPPPDGGSPYDLAARRVEPRQASRPLLNAVSRLLETQAVGLRGLAVVLATFEDAVHFGPRQARTYAALAEVSALVVAFGAGLDAAPAPGVRGADLAAGDPVRREWDLVVVGPHFAGALIARERPDDGGDRAFDYVLTYDRPVVVDLARLLMARVAPLSATERV